MDMGAVIFANRQGLRAFRNPVAVDCAHSLDEVRPCLARMQEGVDQGLYAAGFLAYEAAAAFDPALEVHPPQDFPLAWFALYRGPENSVPHTPGSYVAGNWIPAVSETGYHQAIHAIREYIAAGDTYQVNYTFPSDAAFAGDAFSWFTDLCRAQGADHCAFVDLGRYAVLSASPELFFELDGNRLVTRPMKGTRPRGFWLEQDRRLARELAESPKDRAENVMIVDLLRNDMGRISIPGTVVPQRLFDVERYETVWQMTSTIASKTEAQTPEILAALFPSGSVTGAPKVRTMQIIRELESFPRGVYCGAIGWWGPRRQASFNVAIRTVTLDRDAASARYHVGGGITWDSTPTGEYEECRVKAAVVGYRRPAFELLESLLWDGNYYLLDEHLARLAASAEYFDIPVDAASVEASLRDQAAGLSPGQWKVRLRIAQDGAVRLDAAPVSRSRVMRVGFACSPVDSNNLFLYHKTTQRTVYETANASRPDCDDVLLWNSRGEVTESTIANLVVKIGDEWLTPPLSSGLLGGTLRASLLAEGRLREAVLTKTDVVRASAVKLINSVRKWIPVRLADTVF